VNRRPVDDLLWNALTSLTLAVAAGTTLVAATSFAWRQFTPDRWPPLAVNLAVGVGSSGLVALAGFAIVRRRDATTGSTSDEGPISTEDDCSSAV
jgi:hypothetical protein